VSYVTARRYYDVWAEDITRSLESRRCG